MSDLMGELPDLLGAHTRLALLTVTVAVLGSVPLGVLAHRRPRLGQALVGIASVIQTIPGLALLAIMVPLLAALSLPSIGVLPAFAGLTLYGVLPILQNTITGLRSVPGPMVEAAQGVGMTPRQQLFRVELPLALPVIVAGIRTSAVWTVGMATLSTPIGAPSLGNYIFAGLQTRRFELVLIGCLGSAVLALTVDGLIRALERGVRTRTRGWTWSGTLGLGALALASTLPLALSAGAPPIRIGAKTFTEQYVLAEVLREEAEAAQQPAEIVSSLGSTVVFDALSDSEIDVYVDYSGTIWATIMEQKTSGTERARVLESVRAWLRAEKGIEVLAALGFENTYALATCSDLGVDSIDALAGRAGALVMGGDYEWFRRSEWRDLERAYGLAFREERTMDASLMYDALRRGDVDVISAYSTDGRIAAFDLVLLEDPRQVIPPYDALVLARPGFSADHPEVASRLRALEGAIDGPTMRRLNQLVDGEGRSPSEAARAFRNGR